MSWHYLQTEIIICALRVNWSLSRLCQDTLRWYTYAYKVSLLTLTSWHAVIYCWCILLLKVNHSIIDVNVCVYVDIYEYICMLMYMCVCRYIFVYICVCQLQLLFSNGNNTARQVLICIHTYHGLPVTSRISPSVVSARMHIAYKAYILWYFMSWWCFVACKRKGI